MKKENILIIVSVLVFLYALFLNMFCPVEVSRERKIVDNSGVKTDFKSAVSKYVSNDVAGLSFGYLLGEKSELPPGVEDKMKAVGMAHIIVVSGTHLSIIIGFSKRIFSKISRLAAVYFSVVLLGIYITLIGFSPSVIRASFVAVLALIAWYFGRRQKPIRTVVMTAAFCLLVNPYFLTNISFQLSMLAYSGVVLIMPMMIRYFYGRDRPGFVGSTILSSTAAIIACFPIQMYYFGSFNLLSLLANLLILPTIPYAMGLSFLTGVLGMIHLDFLAVGFGKLSEFLLQYHIKVVSELNDKSEFLFQFEKENPIWFLIYVLVVVLLIVGFVNENVKVSKGDAGDDNNSLHGVDAGKDVG